MTQSELDLILNSDPYHVSRKKPTEAEQRLLLREVDFHCPLCGKDIHPRTQRKGNHKQYEIAHIYPNRPSIGQYTVLHGLERLGISSEDSDNKIVVCLQCHSEQDDHTTKEDYVKLLNIKKKLINQNALEDAIRDITLEKELDIIVEQICNASFAEQINLNMQPVKVADKFDKSDSLLLSKVSGYIIQHYTFLRDLFRERDGKNGFVFSALCCEIKTAFVKMATISNDKEMIFNQLVSFIQNKTKSMNQTACEVVAAFFVQNCEVFYEIS